MEECGGILYVELPHTIQTDNNIIQPFNPLFLGTETDALYTNTYQHRTSYVKSVVTLLAPSK